MGTPQCIYTARTDLHHLETCGREIVDPTIHVIVKIENVKYELHDLINTGEGPDDELRLTCEKLIQSIETVRHKLSELEGFSRDLLDTLAFIAEYDEHREQWYLEEEIWSREE